MTDLTKGNPASLLLKFWIPLMLSQMFQQLYNIADSIIAGQLIGISALGAIAASYPATMLYLAFGGGARIGISVIVARRFGEENSSRMKHFSQTRTAIYTALIGITCVALVCSIIGWLLIPHLMTALHTPVEIYNDCIGYLNVFIIGAVPIFIYNACAGIFAALGDSKTPLYFLIASSVLNCFADVFFIKVIPFGVVGTAIATFECQTLCAVGILVLLLLRLRKMGEHGVPSHNGSIHKIKVFDKEEFRKISEISVPSIIQQSFVSVGNIFIQSVINRLGAAAVAGINAAVRINMFATASISTLGDAVSSYTAQNIGANKTDRIRKGYKSAMVVGCSLTAVLSAAIFFAAKPLISLFMNQDEMGGGSEGIDAGEALRYGILFSHIVSPAFIAVTPKLISDGVLRGAGKMKMFLIATFLDMGLRVVLVYALYPFFSAKGIAMAWPIGWFIGSILSVIFYFVTIKGLYPVKEEKQ